MTLKKSEEFKHAESASTLGILEEIILRRSSPCGKEMYFRLTIDEAGRSRRTVITRACIMYRPKGKGAHGRTCSRGA